MPTGVSAKYLHRFPAKSEHNSSDDKAAWRQWARQQRQHNAQSRPRSSQLISKQLIGLICSGYLSACQHVLGFAPFGDEPDLWPLWEMLLRDGVQMWLPKINGQGHMDFWPWKPGQPLVENTFGIGEPVAEGDKFPFSAERTDDAVCILPMLAGQLSGYRLGYGGGYYDRFMARMPRLMSIGVVTEHCLIPSALAWQPQPYDQPVDVLVTERRVITQAATAVMVAR